MSLSVEGFLKKRSLLQYGGNAARLRQDIALMRKRFPNLIPTGRRGRKIGKKEKKKEKASEK